MMVRAEIQQIVLAHPRRYRYRRIMAELRRQGLVVNLQASGRGSMRDNTCWCSSRGCFVATTDAQHDLEVYLNLAGRLTLTGMNQL